MKYTLVILLLVFSSCVGCTSTQSRDLFFGVYNLSARESPQRVADLSGLTLYEYREHNGKNTNVFWVHDNGRDPAVAYFATKDFAEVTRSITVYRTNPVNGDRIDQWKMEGNDSSDWITFWNQHGEHHFSHLRANGPNRSVPLPQGISWVIYFPRSRL